MPTAAKSLLQSRWLDQPGEASFRAVADTGVLKVNRESGVINGVSLLTADREATGWCMWIDAKTLSMFAALLEGRKLKAYATHGAWGGDGTLDEVGLWENARLDGAQLRSDFSALTAWRKHHEDEFDTLFELADKAPEEFGASLKFRYTLAWVRKNGEDVPVSCCGWDEDDDCPRFEPAAPADAVRDDFPSVRPVKVMSADFVDEPAGNTGLFRAQVDVSGKGALPPTISAMLTIKDLSARFSANPAHLARAVALSAANESHTLDQIAATITSEEQSAELAALRSGAESAKTEIAALKAIKTTHEADEAKLSAAGFKAEGGKSALDAALAAVTQFKTERDQAKADLATLKAGGALPVRTGEGGEGAAAPAGSGALTGVRRAAAAFSVQIEASGLQKPAAKK